MASEDRTGGWMAERRQMHLVLVWTSGRVALLQESLQGGTDTELVHGSVMVVAPPYFRSVITFPHSDIYLAE